MGGLNLLSSEHKFMLQRLVLIDSYSRSGEAVLNLSDGAILTGDNGAGKTSLLSLIPIFYGEHPGRCTSGNNSFGDFYLPNSTSYIIFEYSRRGHAYMAVLYGVGEGAFNYRFIRGHYDLALFTENGDGATLLPAHDLKVRLKTSGVLHSPVLSHAEYRNIIQGRVAGGRTASENRSLVAEYAFTDSGHKLLHIEKIVSGMFSRKANFDEILRVIVDYISEDGNAPISITGVREQYAEWPAQFAAYNEVMQHADLMVQVEDIDSQMKANSHELRLLHGKLLLLGQYYADQHRKATGERNELAERHSHEQHAFSEALLKLQTTASQAKVDADEAGRRMHAIDVRAKSYADERIGEKALLVERISEFHAEVGRLNARKETLLGESSKIEQRYQTLAIDLGQKHLAFVSISNNKIDLTRIQYDPELESNKQSLHDADRTLADEAAATFTALREKRDKAIEQVVHWQGQVNNPIATPELVEAQETKLREQTLAYEKLHGTQTERKNLDHNKTAALRAYQQQDKELGNLRLRLTDVHGEMQQVLSQLNPDKDSLLYFLRTNKPDWPTDIARVIRKDVLSMKSLSPSLDGDGGTLYGVSLDLSRIDAPLCASETALQEQLAACRDEQESLKDSIMAAELSLAELEQRRETCDEALLVHDADVAGQTSRLATLKTELNAARRAAEASVNSARQQAQQQLARAKDAVETCDRAIREEEQALKLRRQDCASRHAAIESKIKDRRDGAIALLKRDIKDAEAEHRQRLQQLEIEKAAALSAQGVDTKVLQAIENDALKLRGLIQEGESWRERVTQWQFWLQNELPSRELHEATAIASRHRQKVAEAEQGELSAQWNRRQTDIHDKLSVLDTRIRTLDQEQHNIHSKVQQLADFPPSPDDMAQKIDAAWTALELFGHANGLLSTRKALHGELVGHIRKIKASFSSVRGSPTEQYFSTMRAEVDPDESNHAAWVKPFRNWFSREHEARRHILMMQASSYGALIADFHDKLVWFHKEVGRFNNKIQQALNQVNVFRCISSVVIQFDSTLDKLKYWTDVTEFNLVYQEWKRSATDMPPPEFAEKLKRLIGHWEVREGIRAERRSLINIRGEVVENGNHKIFRTTTDLGKLSSNGLSYLILCTIFVAFIRMIRGDASVQITWAVDELLDLDTRNIHDLLTMLGENDIRLVSACPEANIDILAQFAKLYRIQRSGGQPEIVEFTVDMMGDNDV